MKFTVELEDKTVIVEADTPSFKDGILSFYSSVEVPVGNINIHRLDLVGRFDNVKCFYVSGGSDNTSIALNSKSLLARVMKESQEGCVVFGQELANDINRHLNNE